MDVNRSISRNGVRGGRGGGREVFDPGCGSGRSGALERRPLEENHGLAVVDGASKDHRQRLVEAELEDFDVLALVRLAATL